MKVLLTLILILSSVAYAKDSIVEQDRKLMIDYMCKPNLLNKLIKDPHVDVNDEEILNVSDGTGMKYASYLYFAIKADKSCPEKALESAMILLENGANPNLHNTSAVLYAAIFTKYYGDFFELLTGYNTFVGLPLPPATQSTKMPDLFLLFVNYTIMNRWRDKDFLSEFERVAQNLHFYIFDLNSTSEGGQNALHLAARAPYQQVVTPDSTYPAMTEVGINKILIKLGVSVDKEDVNGLRPLDWVFLIYNHHTHARILRK